MILSSVFPIRSLFGAFRVCTMALLLTVVSLSTEGSASFDRGYIEGIGGYSGRTAECGTFEIYSGSGSGAIADEIERIVCRSVGEISTGIGLEHMSPVAVVIAEDTPSFRRLHGGRVPEWGEAFSDSRRMIIGIDASRVLLSGRPLETVMRHELSHVILSQRTAGARLPTWLVEGIAMRQSREWTLGDQWRLALMVWREDMLHLEDLEGRFPRNEIKAAMAYRISYAAVEELFTGQEHALVTFTAFLRDTGDFEKAFTLTFGETTAEYSTRFSAVMANRYRKTAVLLHASPYGLSLSALFLLAYFIKRQRSRRRIEQWEREDAGPRIV